MYIENMWDFKALVNEPLQHHCKTAIGMTHCVYQNIKNAKS